MCDIEKVYNSDSIMIYIDNIDFQYNQFMCVNNDFSTTYDNAIKFGFDKLKPFIDQNIDMVECYLTIQKYGETYVWYFYAVGKTEVKFVLFDDKLNVLAMSWLFLDFLLKYALGENHAINTKTNWKSLSRWSCLFK